MFKPLKYVLGQAVFLSITNGSILHPRMLIYLRKVEVQQFECLAEVS